MLRRIVDFLGANGFLARASIFELALGLVLVSGIELVLSSLINDIAMPIVGLLTGGVSFTNKFLALSSNVKSMAYTDATKEGLVLGYGAFIQSLITLLVMVAIVVPLLRLFNHTVFKDVQPPKSPNT